MVGKTYRVPVFSASKSGTRGRAREDNELQDLKRPKINKEDDDDKSDNSASSSSSSSSSSSRDKKKKKSKKNKKAKKDKKKKAKDAKEKKKQQEQEKRKKKEASIAAAASKTKHKFCTDVQAKVASCKEEFDKVAVAYLAPTMADSFHAMHKQLKELLSDVNAVLPSDSNREVRHASNAKDAKSFLANAKRRGDTFKQLSQLASRVA